MLGTLLSCSTGPGVPVADARLRFVPRFQHSLSLALGPLITGVGLQHGGFGDAGAKIPHHGSILKSFCPLVLRYHMRDERF